MNVFYYRPYHVDLQEFPPGYFKLADVTEVTEPDHADCFVLPVDIRYVSDQQLLELPWLIGNEARHVFFSLGEHPTRALPFNAIGFRTDHNRNLATANPMVLTQPWPVEDLARYAPLPDAGFKYDVHAQLWASAPLTDTAVEACLTARLKVHDQRQPFFYGTLETANDPRLPALRRSFLETMQASRIVLVPRSRAAVNRYRFYEALSMGRVPLLLCDACEVPFPDAEVWQHSLRLHEADAHLTGVYLKEFLASHSDAELIERGTQLRQFWAECLAPSVWEKIWTFTVAARLAQLQNEVHHVPG